MEIMHAWLHGQIYAGYKQFCMPYFGFSGSSLAGSLLNQVEGSCNSQVGHD